MASQPDDKTLNLYPIDYPFETLHQRMNTSPPKLILDPDFQRKYKWDNGGWVRASRFIESCLMRIPLPSCYFAEDEERKHLVIDGVQRLTTINHFFKDGFALEGLTAFKNLEGKKFSELGEYRSELESTTIRCIVLRKENPKSLIREIFSRLNQGAVELTAQEIRHAIYPGRMDNLVIELSQTPIIKNFGMGESGVRKKDGRESEEQVLRFFAFHEKFDKYEGNLKIFLDDYMEDKAELQEADVEVLRELYLGALKKCEKVFGDYVFCDTTRQLAKQGLVYYDLLMPTVGLLSQSVVDRKAKKIRAAFEELCNSESFRRTMSGGLQKKSSLLKRRHLWREFLGAI
ncbi:Protein of unknown function DUF262 [Pseudomonas sp. ok272]|uniref:GmrSD restriction endonuclease domain-containing protein n=1 Tax=unclassified Pseudomonas TaxID=196821 RepID=UPI0008B79571|nr:MULTISPECIES: DUF262 domain-containing protein [unclassified Pseudomonas]SEN19262.1 Protein of unknown function DUF262 [Pseudomonas sp. ok272]SFN11327.1 Protein of unknown function DUF262 [Pseudomonas sp. ok602]